MSILKDVMNVAAGCDLEDEEPQRIKKTGKKASKKAPKQEPAQDAPKRKPRATKDKFLDAYDYANTEQVSVDLRNALRGGDLSDDLSKLLQVLFDRKAFRDVVMAQADVCAPPPGPDDYYLDFRFVNPDNGDWVNEQAEALLKSGTDVDGLRKFNIELRVVRKRKLDDTEIQEGTPEDYEEIKQKINSNDTDK